MTRTGQGQSYYGKAIYKMTTTKAIKDFGTKMEITKQAILLGSCF